MKLQSKFHRRSRLVWMVKVLGLVTSLILIASLGLPSSQAQGPQGTGVVAQGRPLEFAPGQILVKFKPGVTGVQINGVNTVNNVTVLEFNPVIGYHKLRIPEQASVTVMVNLYSNNPLVEWAEPNGIMQATVIPNDPRYDDFPTANEQQRWYHQLIDAENGWDIEQGNSAVVIAIVDSGVDLDHPDLISKMWTDPSDPINGMDDDGDGYLDDFLGFDFVGSDDGNDGDQPPDNNPDVFAGDPSVGDGINQDAGPNDTVADDGVSHGTWVAGVAGASTNNGIGVAGTCWNCQLMAVRVLNPENSGFFSDIADGITYAAVNGADIINLSLGGPFSQVVEDAVTAAHDTYGALVVASAGNGNTSPISHPARSTNAFGVGASDMADPDGRARFSQWGGGKPGIPGGGSDVVAPGVNNYSTTVTSVAVDGTGGAATYGGHISGTSFSAPLTSGLAGLIKSADLSLTNDQIAEVIRQSAMDLPDDPNDAPDAGADWDGFGMIQVAGALTLAIGTDIRIEKMDSPDPVTAGEQLSYGITVINDGPNTATNVNVTDTLPPGVSFASSPDGCTETAPGSGIVTCSLAVLANAGNASFTIIVSVSPSVADGAILTNTAEVTADEPDPNPDNNMTTSETTVIREADLSIVKTDSTDPVVAGENLTYIIEVVNDGPSDAAAVAVVDTLPAGVTYVSDTGGCAEAPAGTLTCNLGDLGVSGSVQFDVTVAVAPDVVFNAGGPTTITNAAEVSSATTDPDPNNNNVSEDTLVIAVADLEIVSFEAVDAPAEVLVGQDVAITLRKLITNNGPSGPMDVELTQTATAPADSTVTPTGSTIQEPALGLAELREVLETFTINCGQASHHFFTFGNEIQPLHPEDTDPDQSNNTAFLELDIECVVPVAIDVEPRQINLKGKGAVPVTVLTTAAGEHGLPLAFDAATIDPLSVRFGPQDVVWFETGGAAESHNRGHGTGMGMKFHFIAVETGLVSGDTAACVKGTWLDEAGNAHKFFGCDEVDVK